MGRQGRVYDVNSAILQAFSRPHVVVYIAIPFNLSYDKNKFYPENVYMAQTSRATEYNLHMTALFNEKASVKALNNNPRINP
jgi:hypothetical protein